MKQPRKLSEARLSGILLKIVQTQNEIIEYLIASTPMPSNTIDVERTTRGTIIKSKVKSSSTTTGESKWQ